MKRNLFFTLLFIFAAMLSSAQPYAIGHTTITYTDPSRSNRQIATDLYYPATIAGDNTPIEAGSFPLIVYGHGFVMVTSAYQNFWDALVPQGYILALPSTEGGFSPVHAEFGADLRFLVSQIQSTGAGASIPSTSVAATSAVMGHSMGGGCSFLAAENNTAITTMVSFAAANTTPSSITAAAQVTVPTLLFSGTNDCVAPPSQHQDPMYDATAASYKTQVNITGGGHCYFANYNFNCSFGEGTCTPVPAISRAQQQSAVNDFLELWLAYYLKGNCNAALQFQDSLTASARITYRQSQPIGCTTGLPSLNSIGGIKFYPNPANTMLTLSFHSSSAENYCITLTDITGRVFLSATENAAAGENNHLLDLKNIPAGIYYLQLKDTRNHLVRKIVRS